MHWRRGDLRANLVYMETKENLLLYENGISALTLIWVGGEGGGGSPSRHNSETVKVVNG